MRAPSVRRMQYERHGVAGADWQSGDVSDMPGAVPQRRARAHVIRHNEIRLLAI